jgi:membrane-bound metal-dependent hydrolase YbcI (DUF457 family)
MWHTHAAMGASIAWLLLPFLPEDGSGNISLLMVAEGVGALVPDLGAVESQIKHLKVCGIKPLVPVAKAINGKFGHRGILHSLRAWLIWTLFFLPLAGFTGWTVIASLSFGYASHLAGDACIPAAFPYSIQIRVSSI